MIGNTAQLVGAIPENTAGERLKLLSLSCVFPTPGREGFGAFVRFRLQALARYADISVMSPVAAIDYSHPSGQWLANRKLPVYRRDGRLGVNYPRWIFPPGGGASNGLLLAAQLLRQVKRMRRDFEFDMIDAHFGYPDGIAASILARRVGVPYAITLRGNETMHAERGGIRSAMARAIEGAARVITVSRPLRDFAVLLGAREENVKVIPNGVDGTIFYPRDRAAARRKLQLDEAAKVVLSAGSLIERKGHHHVVRALASVRQSSAPVELLIAGEAGREGRYETQIREAVAAAGLTGSVRFLGQLSPDELAECMSAADLFCLSSSREGWPNVIHEAMACGTPVVATRVGSVEEMVAPEFGITVAPGSAEALADGMAQALGCNWDRGRIARWGKSRDWEKVAGEIAIEFRSVVAAARSAKPRSFR